MKWIQLKLNVKKKKQNISILYLSPNRRTKVFDFMHIHLELNEYNFKRVKQEFRYVLGTHYSEERDSNWNENKEIGNRYYYELKKTLKSRMLTKSEHTQL